MRSSIDAPNVAILGGGPSGLFVFKNLIESPSPDLHITVFEANSSLGAGMPYSKEGAKHEHVTNVSGNEIPLLVTTLEEWIHSVPRSVLEEFNIDLTRFNEYKVVPRLLFGLYLMAQFELLLQRAKALGVNVQVYYETTIVDIIDHTESELVTVVCSDETRFSFTHVIVCTGHKWPKIAEGTIPGYYDSPYPPSKLPASLNHPVAVTGASLTAIDAIRTMARLHGSFVRNKEGKIAYVSYEHVPEFRVVMHSRHGLLPGIRFHLEDPHISKESVISKEEILINRNENNGFLSLDFVFDNDFKKVIQKKDPAFYERIKEMKLEEFVQNIMDARESKDPFLLFKEEYNQAAKSIKLEQPIHWKEILAALSFAMNYPAKHLSAEDMLRLQHVLMPLISIVIAFVPQSSCEELLALHEAGKLELITVGSDSNVKPRTEGGVNYFYTDSMGNEKVTPFDTYVNCVGQMHLPIEQFPYRSLVDSGSVSQALLKFRSSDKATELMDERSHTIIRMSDHDYFLKVSGLAINDHFQAIDRSGKESGKIYIMAVPYIGGYNPDYSGLDFCEAASEIIVDSLFKQTGKLTDQKF